MYFLVSVTLIKTHIWTRTPKKSQHRLIQWVLIRKSAIIFIKMTNYGKTNFFINITLYVRTLAIKNFLSISSLLTYNNSIKSKSSKLLTTVIL